MPAGGIQAAGHGRHPGRRGGPATGHHDYEPAIPGREEENAARERPKAPGPAIPGCSGGKHGAPAKTSPGRSIPGLQGEKDQINTLALSESIHPRAVGKEWPHGSRCVLLGIFLPDEAARPSACDDAFPLDGQTLATYKDSTRS